MRLITWILETPQRALRVAYQAAQTIQIIQREYLDYQVLTPQEAPNLRAYLEFEINKYRRIARLRVWEFQATQALLGGSWPLDTLTEIQEVLEDLDSWRKIHFTVAFEPTGLLPRSIPRTLDRFRRELLPSVENLVIQEFRLSRYQTLASIRALLTLISIPWIISAFIKPFILEPMIVSTWSPQELFREASQQNHAFLDMRAFQESLYFDSLTGDISSASLESHLNTKAAELAELYSHEAIESMANCVGDFLTAIALIIVLQRPQMMVLKSFLDEFLYSLSDATKAFLIILGTDIFVGFHSPHGWEILIGIWLERIGLPDNQTFVLLFVATFPVILDTVLKYWIFRYLNRISPSAVATYHDMNE
jgi:hypothetical protein